jgi:hypothetical protein
VALLCQVAELGIIRVTLDVTAKLQQIYNGARLIREDSERAVEIESIPKWANVASWALVAVFRNKGQCWGQLLSEYRSSPNTVNSGVNYNKINDFAAQMTTLRPTEIRTI